MLSAAKHLQTGCRDRHLHCTERSAVQCRCRSPKTLPQGDIFKEFPLSRTDVIKIDIYGWANLQKGLRIGENAQAFLRYEVPHKR